jgi:uncharacterized protein YxjI
MKKTITILLSFFIYISSSVVFAAEIPNRIPDEMYITEHWVSLTTSYDIDTRTQRLGTLYRKFFSFMLTYDFYDPFANKIAYARSKFFSWTAHFDVYDNNENFLGAADERLFSFFPTFDVYARDGYTKLATASMNFWGTTFYIYDPATNQKMAYMTRSFFRLKNDWTFHVSNRALFDQKGIDPRVLMTVTAFQGDREYWESQNENSLRGIANTKNSGPVSDVSRQQLNALLEKVAAVSRQEGFDNEQAPDEKTVVAVANELENGYRQSPLADTSTQTSQEQIVAFTDYCLNLVQSNTLADSKKKTILFLLKTRLS